MALVTVEGIEITTRIRTREASESMRRLSREAKKTGRDAGDAFTRTAKSVIGLKTALGTLTAALGSVASAFAVIRLGEKSEQIRQVRVSFESLTTAAGTTASTFLRDLKTATDSTITSLQLMREANVGLAAGMDPSKVLQLADASETLARAVGISTAEAFDRVIRATTKLEVELLDELGIAIRLTDVYRRLGVSASAAAQGLVSRAQVQAAFAQLIIERAQLLEPFLETSQRLFMKLVTTTKDFGNALVESFSESRPGQKLIEVLDKLSEKLKETPSAFLTTERAAIDASEAIRQFGLVLFGFFKSPAILATLVDGIALLNKMIASLQGFLLGKVLDDLDRTKKAFSKGIAPPPATIVPWGKLLEIVSVIGSKLLTVWARLLKILIKVETVLGPIIEALRKLFRWARGLLGPFGKLIPYVGALIAATDLAINIFGDFAISIRQLARSIDDTKLADKLLKLTQLSAAMADVAKAAKEAGIDLLTATPGELARTLGIDQEKLLRAQGVLVRAKVTLDEFREATKQAGVESKIAWDEFILGVRSASGEGKATLGIFKTLLASIPFIGDDIFAFLTKGKTRREFAALTLQQQLEAIGGALNDLSQEERTRVLQILFRDIRELSEEDFGKLIAGLGGASEGLSNVSRTADDAKKVMDGLLAIQFTPLDQQLQKTESTVKALRIQFELLKAGADEATARRAAGRKAFLQSVDEQLGAAERRVQELADQFDTLREKVEALGGPTEREQKQLDSIERALAEARERLAEQREQQDRLVNMLAEQERLEERINRLLEGRRRAREREREAVSRARDAAQGVEELERLGEDAARAFDAAQEAVAGLRAEMDALLALAPILGKDLGLGIRPSDDRLVQDFLQRVARLSGEAQEELADLRRDLEAVRSKLLEGASATDKTVAELQQLKQQFREGSPAAKALADAVEQLQSAASRARADAARLEEEISALAQAQDEAAASAAGLPAYLRESAEAARELQVEAGRAARFLQELATSASSRLKARFDLDVGPAEAAARRIEELGVQAGDEIERSLSDALIAVAEGESVQDIWTRMWHNLAEIAIQEITRIIIRMLILRTLMNIFSGFFGGGGGAAQGAETIELEPTTAFAHRGGLITGRGDVPGILQAGEFVVQSKAVKVLGVDFLAALNRVASPEDLLDALEQAPPTVHGVPQVLVRPVVVTPDVRMPDDLLDALTAGEEPVRVLPDTRPIVNVRVEGPKGGTVQNHQESVTTNVNISGFVETALERFVDRKVVPVLNRRERRVF